MRGYLPDFDVRVPASLSEALELMAQAPGTYTPLAGGTDLMVVYNAGRLKPTRFLDLSRLAELRGIEEDATSLRFGALTTFTELRECRAVHQHFPNLVKSARATGALAIQNRGTLAGNIANASPAADTPPSLLAYGAELELVSPRGLRRVAYDQFHQGYKCLDLAADELLAKIIVPKPSGRGFHYFRKVAPARPRPSPRPAWPPTPASRTAAWPSCASASGPWPRPPCGPGMPKPRCSGSPWPACPWQPHGKPCWPT